MKKIVEKIDRDVRIIGGVIAFSLLIMVPFLFKTMEFDSATKKSATKMEELKVRHDEALADSVRKQTEITVDGVKESINNYFIYYPNEAKNIVMYDKDGKVIFSNRKNQTISFDDRTMRLQRTPEKLYDILDSKGNVLIKDSYPEYNSDFISKLARITSANFKMYGPTGDTFWYVPETMLLIFDQSADCAPNRELAEKQDKIYLDKIPDHLAAANKAACNYTIQNKYKWVADSTPDQKLTFFFTEPTIMKNAKLTDPDDSNDFRKYPFGKYKREFQARRILKTTNIGLYTVYGIELRIAIVLGAQEPEIQESFDEYENAYNDTKNSIKRAYEIGVIYPAIIALIAVFISVFALFAIKNIEKKAHINIIDEQ